MTLASCACARVKIIILFFFISFAKTWYVHKCTAYLYFKCEYFFLWKMFKNLNQITYTKRMKMRYIQQCRNVTEAASHLVPNPFSPRTFGPPHLVPKNKQSRLIWSPWTNGPQDNWSPWTIGPQTFGPNGQMVPKTIGPPGQMVPKIGPHGQLVPKIYY